MTGPRDLDPHACTLRLGDDRLLGYARYGASDADATLFYFHGLPGSRVEARLLDGPARLAGVRVIAVDRPGYGLSTPCPDRTWTDWASDVATLADALGAARFDILGVSGGGPYALTCAHALAPRVRRVALVCSLGPVFRPDQLRAMHWRFRLAMDLAHRSPALLKLFYVTPVRLFAPHGAEHMLEMLGRFLGGADREVLHEPATLRWLADNLRESLRQSGAGALEDAALQIRPWPFELSDIRVPVTVWHGDADRVVPLAHGLFIHAGLPLAEMHVVPGEGHFSLPIRYGGQVLAELWEEK